MRGDHAPLCLYAATRIKLTDLVAGLPITRVLAGDPSIDPEGRCWFRLFNSSGFAQLALSEALSGELKGLLVFGIAWIAGDGQRK